MNDNPTTSSQDEKQEVPPPLLGVGAPDTMTETATKVTMPKGTTAASLLRQAQGMFAEWKKVDVKSTEELEGFMLATLKLLNLLMLNMQLQQAEAGVLRLDLENIDNVLKHFETGTEFGFISKVIPQIKRCLEHSLREDTGKPALDVATHAVRLIEDPGQNAEHVLEQLTWAVKRYRAATCLEPAVGPLA